MTSDSGLPRWRFRLACERFSIELHDDARRKHDPHLPSSTRNLTVSNSLSCHLAMTATPGGLHA